jgi:hypothetical protein
MIRNNAPESITIVDNITRNTTDGQRLDQILQALIVQTSQVDYDDVTVEQLIHEYERLMS